MVNEEAINVPAPKEWMKGWDKIYNQQWVEMKDEDYRDFFPSIPVQQLMWFTKAEENQKVLEFACGDGSNACYLAKQGYSVEACEALPNALKVAAKRAKILGVEKKVVFTLANMADWSLPAESYDVIVATQCLQYLFDKAVPKLQEILHAIKPTGFFVYSGNILPHEPTTPPIRFITKDELLSALNGWKMHSFGTGEVIIRAKNLRGYIWVVTQKITP